MRGKIITCLVILILIASFSYGFYTMGKKSNEYFDNPYTSSENPYDPPEGGINETVEGNNQFSFSLLQEVNKRGENTFYSPWSVYTALGMVYEGARGDTAEEMRSVFHYPADNETRRKSIATLHYRYNIGPTDYTLRTANGLWIDKGFPIRSQYKTTVEDYYYAKSRNLNLQSEYGVINEWVSEKTNDKIEEIVSGSDINPYTKLILTNAIYFKGDWMSEFKEKNTKKMDFYGSEKTVKADMMYQKHEFNYTSTDDFQILEMPYKGGDLSMMVLLPKGKELSEVVDHITYENYTKWNDELDHEEVKVHFPKFEFETKYKLKGNLKNMGMKKAFTGGADLSGIQNDLFIEWVRHKGYVKVDEKGTEAAAATSVGAGMYSVDRTPTFKADHPFVFMIKENHSGNILFQGKVADPTV